MFKSYVGPLISIVFAHRFITFNIVEDHKAVSIGERTSLANSASAYNLLRAAGESIGLDLSSTHGATDVLITLLDNEIQCNPSIHRRIPRELVQNGA